MGTLPLSRGLVVTVDDADLALLAQWKWSAFVGHNTFYAARRQCIDGKHVLVLMHRLLMAPPAGMVVDHINGDGTDNRRENLRVCTQQQNMLNKRPQKGGSSAIKGAWKDPTAPNKPWRSAIRLNGKLTYLGRFATEAEAGAAYAAAAKQLFGEYHRITDGAPNP